MASQGASKGSGPNLFDLFYDLAAENETTRNAAASSLLKLVLSSQQSFQEAARVAQGTDGPANVSSDVQYTLGRLIKGLGSGRAAARPGFATALVALLREVPAVTTTEVYKAVAESTRTSGSMKGYEERDAYFGRIFGFLCLHRAGRLSVTNDAEAASVGAMPIGRIVGNIVTELATLAAKKAWLSEVCHEALAAIIPSIPQSLYTKYVNGPISNLMGASAAAGPSSAEFRPAQASLVAATSRLYRASADASAAPEFASALAKMVSSADFAPLRPAALSACHAYPHLHTFWRRVGDAWVVAGAMTDAAWHGVAGRSRADADSDASLCPAQPSPAVVASFSAFWAQCVDGPLLAPGASHERKATGLAVLALYLPYAAPEIVDAMLSGNALHVIKVNARKRTNYLHKPARATLQVLAGSVIAAQSPALATAVFTSIMSRGHAQWDQRTRSRVVEYCQRFVDADTLTAYMHSSMAQFVAGAAEGDADAEDDAAADGPTAAAGGAADAADSSDDDASGSEEEDEEDREWKKLAAGLGEGALGAASGPEVQRLWCVDAVSAAAKHLSRSDDAAAAAAQTQATVFMVTHALFRPTEEHNAAVAGVYKALSGAKLPAAAASDGAVVPTPAIRTATAEMVSRKLYSGVWDTAAAAGVAAASARAATRRAAAGAGDADTAPAEGDSDAATATNTALVQLCASIHGAWAAAQAAGAPPAAALGDEGTAAVAEAMQLAQALQQAAQVLVYAAPGAVAAALGVGDSDAVAVGDLQRTALSYGALLAVVAARALSAPVAILPLLQDLLAAARALVLLPLHVASTVAPEAATGKTPKKSKKRKSTGGAAGASGVWRGVPIAAWASDEVMGGEAKAIVVVTDVLLELLSNLGASAGAGAASGALPPPGAALVRETVKLASAGLAPLVNAGAVEAVVSVLAASLEELAPEPAAAAADGDSDSAEDEASDDDAAESDEDSSDEDDDEEDTEEDSAAEAGEQQQLEGDVDDGATAVTEGTLPLPSKAELEAMDRMVSGIVNAKADGAAAAAAAKARRDAALHFQFRASDLLDAWAGRVAGRSQHLLLLMPLLRAARVLGNRVRLSGGSHPCRGIAQRVNALLSKLTAKGAAVPALLEDLADDDSQDGDVQLDAPAAEEDAEGSDDEAEVAGDVLDEEEVGMLGVTLTGAAVSIEECILLASGAAGADFVLAAGRVASVFLRALMADGVLSEQEELLAPVAAVYSDALTSYLTHKNSKLTSKLFAPLWSVGGPAAVAVVPALLHGMAAGVNGFRSADAVTMLGALLRGAGGLLASGASVPQVAMNTAVVGKRLDTAADAAGSDAEGAPPAPPSPADRLSHESVQDIVDAIAVSLSDLLLRAAQAGRLKLPAQLNAARQKDLIAFARQLVAPKPGAAGSEAMPAPQGEARTALVQALSALVHCASSGKVQNAAQSALSRLGQGPLKLDLSWFEGMAEPAGGKKGKGTKRARSGETAVVAKQRASSAFADLAAATEEGEECAGAAAPKSAKKAHKKAKKA